MAHDKTSRPGLGVDNPLDTADLVDPDTSSLQPCCLRKIDENHRWRLCNVAKAREGEDTYGQKAVAFAFCPLLGFAVMPRLLHCCPDRIQPYVESSNPSLVIVAETTTMYLGDRHEDHSASRLPA